MACNTLKVMDIVYSSSVDGVGFRDVVFVAGCPHRCEGCHNPQTWEIENGKEISVGEVFSLLTKSKITDVTFSGGEPFFQAEALLELAIKIKKETHKTIWIYSGYTFEEIVKNDRKRSLLQLCDVLVDGRFVKEQAVPNLRFRGSSNQRLVDVSESLSQNQLILWEE